eukprot:TRINITY_DN35847_c0_g1_i2.p1 TRINITY_DN35847_c0_g1~~TRINITY_DN35847_c0_g1_i2.p1  ORF type:complete len:390 (+),score=88.25 TRINITY_DN35847_c0_g1_i2:180-1349(+)
MLACVKHTFLELVDKEELRNSGSSTRSKSAEATVGRDCCELQGNGKPEQELCCVDRLNILLKTQQILDPMPQRPKEPSLDELLRLQMRLSEATSRSTASAQPAQAIAVAAAPPKLLGLAGKRIQSNSSVSTMATDFEIAEDSLAPRLGGIRKAFSSGSVSSMAGSDFHFEESTAEGGVEFGMIIEEGPMTPFAAQLDSEEVCNDSWSGPIVHPEGNRIAAARDGSKAEFCHNLVPKNVNLVEKFSESIHEAPTTMMIRNIPNRYTQREFVQELTELGFGGSYDFLYLPLDKGTQCNVGYAFVNFLEPSTAQWCTQVFDNYSFKKFQKARGKIAAVSVAHLQGYEANMRHYENSAVHGIARMKKQQQGPKFLPQGGRNKNRASKGALTKQ